jgi:hypothetical protein
VEYCGKLKKPANGEELPAASVEPPRRFLMLFWTSSDWRSCSSSLT